MGLGESERRLDSIEEREMSWEGAKEKYFVSILTSFPGLFPFKKGKKSPVNDIVSTDCGCSWRTFFSVRG